MTFKYTLIPDQLLPGRVGYLPLVDINVGERLIPYKFLIDTGSPVTIIHSPIAVLGGIIPKEGVKGDLLGIGGERIAGFYHNLEFNLYGIEFKSQVFVTANLKTPYGLLGQIDFFQKFRVVFDLRKLIFEVTPKFE